MLKAGEIVLVDFDGVIVENYRPDGTTFYPEIGPIKRDIVCYLEVLHKYGIRIVIWSARTNPKPPNKDYPIYGELGLKQLHKFLQENDIKYDEIFLEKKPIGHHFAKLLIDDCVINPDIGVEEMIRRTIDVHSIHST